MGINKIIIKYENTIKKHLDYMNTSPYRIILFDSVLWMLFILYYIGHFVYTKQFRKFENEHKGYEKLLNEKDVIVFIVIILALILYIHFFFLYKN